MTNNKRVGVYGETEIIRALLDLDPQALLPQELNECDLSWVKLSVSCLHSVNGEAS